MLRRKKRLPRGLPLRKVDPAARWLVKNTERYAAKQTKTAKRLKRLESRRQVQFTRDAIAACIVLLALSVNLFYVYVYIAPVSLIAHVSPTNARWVDVLRKSGCTDNYARSVFFSPLLNAEGKFLIRNQYLDCAKERMDFPA
jgi:hypothetical protein